MASNALPVAIVGAGLAGLTAAHFLRQAHVPVIVFEAGSQVGGLAKTFKDDDGYSHDFGAHFITNRLAAAIGVGAHCRDVVAYGESVFVGGRARRYPAGLIAEPHYLQSALRAHAATLIDRRTTESAAQHFRAEYGRALADEVAIPLVEAWSGESAVDLSPAVAEKLPCGPFHTLYLAAAATLTHRSVAIGYCRSAPESPHVWHVYPEGGVGMLCEGMAAELGRDIRLDSPVERIDVAANRVVSVRVRGRDIAVAAVMSTAPVFALPRLVHGSDRLAALAQFRYRAMVFVNLRFSGRELMPNVVTWTPGRTFPFFRLTETTRAMPWLAPDGKSLVTADFGCDVGDTIWTMSDDSLAERALAGIELLAPGIRSRFISARTIRTPIAYPIFHRSYEPQRRAFEQSTGINGLYSIGRNGEFAHILMEDVYWRSRAQAQRLLEERSHREVLRYRDAPLSEEERVA